MGEGNRGGEKEARGKGGFEGREGVVQKLTGTVTIVSAINRYFSQCSTKLPLKCPPVLIAVTPGTISVFVPGGPSM